MLRCLVLLFTFDFILFRQTQCGERHLFRMLLSHMIGRYVYLSKVLFFILIYVHIQIHDFYLVRNVCTRPPSWQLSNSRRLVVVAKFVHCLFDQSNHDSRTVRETVRRRRKFHSLGTTYLHSHF